MLTMREIYGSDGYTRDWLLVHRRLVRRERWLRLLGKHEEANKIKVVMSNPLTALTTLGETRSTYRRDQNINLDSMEVGEEGPLIAFLTWLLGDGWAMILRIIDALLERFGDLTIPKDSEIPIATIEEHFQSLEAA